ncbi:MAG: hypothetical protein M3O88_04625 [Actinomycetota bacterium]|nr:hypothetical protein [Actinomycetota bacterium]
MTRQWTSNRPDVPTHGDERAHINFWLFRGAPPSDGRAVNVVLSDFSFVPAS